jgi:signal transduction histidine kinase
VRTPIAILQMRLEQSPPFPDRQKLLLDVARLSALAEELLELQRIGQTSIPLLPLDLVDLVEEVVGDLAPLAISAGYQIAVNSTADVSPVLGDARSLYRAVANLVQNAIAYGGGLGEILVTVSAKGQIAVEDAGQGVPEAERQRIFEPFQRIHHAGGGTGLGLTLVQTIMSLHNGSVSVGSSRSGGAKFVLHFPKAQAPLEKIGDGKANAPS